MATIRQRASGSWEVIIRSKKLPKPYYATLDSEAEAVEYARKLEARIEGGDIPRELLEPAQAVATVGGLVALYVRSSGVSAHDAELLPRLPDGLKAMAVERLTSAVLLKWVADLHNAGSAPGTIRKKVGALARLLDWAVLTGRSSGNPARQLPRNYAAYPVAHDKRRGDVERERRLEAGEEARIVAVLADRPEWLLLFNLAIETAMRLREMFTLDWSQVDLARRTVFLDKTKNGDKRQVPLSSVMAALLSAVPVRTGRVFPWWDGQAESLAKTTARLSHQWARIAQHAGCADLVFHDLRHEATCRLYERTTLGDVQIARITGHKSLAMLKRYANLRGSDLAGALW